jgi:hypothetical protein
MQTVFGTHPSVVVDTTPLCAFPRLSDLNNLRQFLTYPLAQFLLLETDLVISITSITFITSSISVVSIDSTGSSKSAN